MPLNVGEYLDAFIQDAEELLQDLDDNLLALRKQPDRTDIVHNLFRVAHTLKGNSGMIGFQHLQTYTHALESVMSLIRSGERTPDDDLFDLLFDGFGYLHDAIRHLKTTQQENVDELVGRTQLLKEFLSGDVRATPRAKKKPDGPERSSKHLRLGDTVRVDVGKMDELLNAVGELIVSRTRVIELVDFYCATGDRKTDTGELSEVLRTQGRILASVQESVMKARMVPLRHLFDRCPRIASELATRLGKRIDVRIDGSATELDKRMIDALSEPLLHLISNAVAHGIESPDARRAAGKSETGVIRIMAYGEHNQVVVTIEDDGAGVDLERLAEAIENVPDDRQSLSDGALLDALCRPGLSLAKTVTDVAGRGVGLDAARACIEAVNGSLELATSPGAGTRFLVRLPLTLAIVPGLLMRYRGSIFVIPLGFVSEVVDRKDGVVRHIDRSNAVLEFRDEVLPIVPLDTVLEFDEAVAANWSYLIIAGVEDRRIAIPADRLLGDREIVMKTLSPLLGVSRFISGASILGNGDIALVVDMFSLCKS